MILQLTRPILPPTPSSSLRLPMEVSMLRSSTLSSELGESTPCSLSLCRRSRTKKQKKKTLNEEATMQTRVSLTRVKGDDREWVKNGSQRYY